MVNGGRSGSWRSCFSPRQEFTLHFHICSPPSMRRIPRPTRAIDSSSSYLQLRSISRNRQIPACNHLCSTAAAFSTSAPYTFLLSGKQDKKKHQQFVRRWQKRLLGDSEPIGAHVDPYDPTSPVRIAPEEQGEYEEVLEEDKPGTALGNPPKAQYEPATNGHHLSHVGGELWIKHKLEQEMAREFEKLTLRTYTPLSLNMANEIEDLTGTPYTLRDENLMMAQTTHEVTARPYTAYNFGMHTKSKKPRELRARFIQAVAEVYGLKHAGLNMDVSKLSNRGIYNPPTWVKDVRLSRAQNGELILLCPKNKDVSQLIQAIQATPTWEPTFAGEEAVATEEFPLEESSEPLNTAPAQEALPTIDPDTPAFKRAAVVKMDAEKPFDFMSNRPVPRTQFLPKSERATDKTIESNASEARPLLVDAQLVELNRAVNESQSIIGELRRYFIEHRVQILDNNLEALRSAVLPAECGSAVKWSEVCIDDFVKFAVSILITLELPQCCILTQT